MLAAAITAMLFLLRPAAPRPGTTVVRAVLPITPAERFAFNRRAVAVSPDGETVVFTGIHQGAPALFRRALSGRSAELIRGTERGHSPFFSPDGQWIGFFTRAELKKVPLSGGTAVSLSNLPPITAGASWAENGQIVLTRKLNGPLDVVPAAGGALAKLTQLDTSAGEHGHLFPQVLPGGRGVLFTLRKGRDYTDTAASSIAVLDQTTGKRNVILEGASFARYGAGRLVFVRGPSVFSVPFDLNLLSVTGPPVPILETVVVHRDLAFGHFDLSAGGTLVFLEGPPTAAPNTSVLLLDRTGKEKSLPVPPGEYYGARFSPDGGRLVLSRFENLRGTIVIYDRGRNILTTLTPEPGSQFIPIWSPDGRRIAFSRYTDAMPTLSAKNADGSGEIEPLTEPSEDAQFADAWSPDGKTILYTVAYTADRGPKRKILSTDLWLVSHGDRRSARPWFESPFRETAGTFSPDGRWIAYVSDESGVKEIYIRPYPGPGAAVKVSNGFAIEPLWSRDGKELFYRTGENAEKFMTVAIRTLPELTISAPQLLFSSEVEVGGQEDRSREYDVSADGHFVGQRSSRTEEPNRQLVVVTNWAKTLGP